MSRLLPRIAGLVAAIVLCPAVSAQVESHLLPKELPATLFPAAVLKLPNQNSHVLSVPIVDEKAASSRDGRDKARELLGLEEDSSSHRHSGATKMPEQPAQIVQLAKSQQYQEAARRGQALLQQKKTTYNDFTWDYLGNATAWACIQTGDFEAASRVHHLTALRLNEPAVRSFHNRASALIAKAVPKDDQDAKARELAGKLANAESYRQQLRKALLADVKKFQKTLDQFRKAGKFDTWTSQAGRAYTSLRFIFAVDVEIGRQLQEEFAGAADSLVVAAAPALLEKARKQQLVLVKLERRPMKSSDAGRWNAQLKKLWGHIQEVKRICRAQDYLSRLGLAGQADTLGPFTEAHKLLFTPDDDGAVFKLTGGTVDGVLDMTRRGPADDISNDIVHHER